jgi:hypothetical protein
MTHSKTEGGRDMRQTVRRGVAPLNLNPKWPEGYVAVLREAGGNSNWQIAQARDALELYYEQFRGIALAPRSDHVVASTPSATSTNRQEAKLGDQEPWDGTRKAGPAPSRNPGVSISSSARPIPDMGTGYRRPDDPVKNIVSRFRSVFLASPPGNADRNSVTRSPFRRMGPCHRIPLLVFPPGN